jgi:hypothetical protein
MTLRTEYLETDIEIWEDLEDIPEKTCVIFVGQENLAVEKDKIVRSNIL